MSVDDNGDTGGEWQQSDLTATLPAGLQLDAATMLELQGTLFSGETASTEACHMPPTAAPGRDQLVHSFWFINHALQLRAQGLQHAAREPVSAATPAPKQRKKTMHSWQRTVPRLPMAAAVPQPPTRRSPAVISHLPVHASAESPSIPRRSLVDVGLLHGASTRVSWSAGGKFAKVGEHCGQCSSDGPCQQFPNTDFCVCTQMAVELRFTGSVLRPRTFTCWARRLQMGQGTVQDSLGRRLWRSRQRGARQRPNRMWRPYCQSGLVVWVRSRRWSSFVKG